MNRSERRTGVVCIPTKVHKFVCCLVSRVDGFLMTPNLHPVGTFVLTAARPTRTLH